MIPSVGGSLFREGKGLSEIDRVIEKEGVYYKFFNFNKINI